ncbi:hypothetical protein KSS87_015487 [Heliosperma pusillum]|nr:hypothetical protein KSS87_015487 [Heliosperma pusillum]
MNKHCLSTNDSIQRLTDQTSDYITVEISLCNKLQPPTFTSVMVDIDFKNSSSSCFSCRSATI